METFLVQAIKRANTYKDHNKIKTLGPFAMYLAEVIYIAQRARKIGRNDIVSLQPQFDAFIGASLSEA